MEINRLFYFIGGIEGVGKTSVASRTADFLPATQFLSASSAIREKSGANNISVLTFYQQTHYLIKAVQEDLKRNNKRRLLLDAHYLCFSDEGTYYAIKDNFWKNVTAFVHLSVDPDQIYLRSTRDELDGTKQRYVNNLPLDQALQEIARRQDLSYTEAIAVAKYFNRPFIDLYNNEAIDRTMLNLIKQLANTENVFRIFS